MTGSNENLTYDVRIWKVKKYEGKRSTTYTVRWTVAGREFPQTFATAKLADSFRSKLTTAAREGIPFDIPTGLPEPLARTRNRRSWYEHACAFVDMKWPHAAPNHRRNIVEALTSVTMTLLPQTASAPAAKSVRATLRGWSFNRTARGGKPIAEADAPNAHASAARWITENSPDLSELRDTKSLRRVLDDLAVKLDGKAAAPATISRKRSALYSALEYAVELELFESNPIDKVQWTMPEHTDLVDRRVVANPEQVRLLLSAVREIAPWLEAFYGCLYYGGLRPAEARHLAELNCVLPEKGWGELLLTGSTQQAGRAWTDSGESKEDRSLKHRAVKATRQVPACPDLVKLLRAHIAEYKTGPGGRLFVSRTGAFGRPVAAPYSNPVHPNSYGRVWAAAREKALTPVQAASQLAKRPYDLRHAAVSLWLNAGVPATQVAEWAGHSVNVLLRVYAKCVDGQDELAKRRIETALGTSQSLTLEQDEREASSA